MRKFVLSFLVVLGLALPLASVPTVAYADRSCNLFYLCGRIDHYAPDTGYDAAIITRCNARDPYSRVDIKEGASSKWFCADIGSVYVRSNEEIWCKVPTERYFGKWSKMFDSTGWHTIKNTFNDGSGCVVQRD